MAEWSIASDLKSDELTGSVSSNLTLSFFEPYRPCGSARDPTGLDFFFPQETLEGPCRSAQEIRFL